MKIRKLIVFCAAVLAGPTSLAGQETPSVTSDLEASCRKDPRPEIRAYCKDLAALQAAVNQDKSIDADKAQVLLDKLDFADVNATVNFITATAPSLAVRNALSKIAQSNAASSNALQTAGQSRPDQQLGTNGSGSGTTTLVSKAGSAELLSLALDTGVLVRSVNGTTATLSTNADQVFRLISGSDPDCTVTCNDLGWFENKMLNPTNVSATLDLAQQGSKTTATSGQASGTTPTQVNTAAIPTGAGKLSGITVRYQLLNRFDPRSPAFRRSWAQAVAGSALKSTSEGIGDATDDVADILATSATSLKRDEILDVARNDSTGRKLIDYFEKYFSDASQKPLQDPKIVTDISQVMQERALYRQAWLDALHQAAGNLFTLEYDYTRPSNQPLTHDFRLIYAYDSQTMGMLTFNGSVSLYDSIPPAAKYGRLHYGQVSTEYDRTITGKDKSFQTQLSLAGYWQYQPHPSILNIPAGTVVPGTTIPLPNGTQEFVGAAGSLWVTQAKLTIKGSGGINIPIGVSWSNKTDLLQGSKVGAQVGISYNFSSLAGLFTGSSGQ